MKSDTEYTTQIQPVGISNLITDLRDYHRLTPRQSENITQLIVLSDKFGIHAGLTNPPKERITPEMVVLESGHQPNYLPHCGTWKKAFLLDRVQQELNKRGIPSVALFGFADLNLSTAKVLARNHIPSVNKTGSLAIGFGIREEDKFKEFYTLPKPPREFWQKEMDRLWQVYRDAAKSARTDISIIKPRSDALQAIIGDCYERAGTFAELNSSIFARISQDLFGITIRYYLYSDLQRENLFLEESRRLLTNLSLYNQEYNRVIAEKNLNVPQVKAPTYLPFWYSCTCGTKLGIILDSTLTGRVICPACNKEHIVSLGEGFNSLAAYYGRMDFQAVSRDLVISEGIGSSLFIPGCGGSVSYGEISRSIAVHLGFHLPRILRWRSADYYLGMAHVSALDEMSKISSCTIDEMCDPAFPEILQMRVRNLTEDLGREEAGSADKREILRLKNRIRALTNLCTSVHNIFSLHPSVLDVIVNQGPEEVAGQWDHALYESGIPRKGDRYSLSADIVYPCSHALQIPTGQIPVIYRSMQNLGGT